MSSLPLDGASLVTTLALRYAARSWPPRLRPASPMQLKASISCSGVGSVPRGVGGIAPSVCSKARRVDSAAWAAKYSETFLSKGASRISEKNGFASSTWSISSFSGSSGRNHFSYWAAPSLMLSSSSERTV
eukprot:2156677-Prymnesium_polylepis.2